MQPSLFVYLEMVLADPGKPLFVCLSVLKVGPSLFTLTTALSHGPRLQHASLAEEKRNQIVFPRGSFLDALENMQA